MNLLTVVLREITARGCTTTIRQVNTEFVQMENTDTIGGPDFRWGIITCKI